MERNVRSFDIASPIQAFQYATFLVRLREQDRVLENLFKEKGGNLGKLLENRWTKKVQHDELHIGGNR
jgi:hypothetical protein